MTDKTEAMDLAKTLAELSARASGGQWHHQSGGVTGRPWISTDNWTRQDGTYVRGGCILNMVAHDERQDDAAFIAALVNAYRTGKMIVVPDDAVEVINGCEMPEVAAMRYIEELRSDLAASVTILCNNDEAWAKDDQMGVEVIAEWTDWVAARFMGESVVQCLAKAILARTAALAALKGADHAG